MMLLCHAFCFAQGTKKLTGTWYAKLERRLEHATANIYTKRPVEHCKEKLVINNEFHYTYTRQTGNKTTVTEGNVTLKKDTILFTPEAKYGGIPMNFYLYRLNNDELIYSSSVVHTTPKEEEESIFQRVEVSASYSKGENAFLAAIYNELGQPASRDTIQLNTYHVVVDTTGKADIGTLEETHACPAYFTAVKKALQHLPAPFIPAQQNGRYVKAWMKFSITY